MNQVDPPFLFNSFNTLVALIETDTDQAVGHVQRLSTFFRVILQFRDRETIALIEEEELAKAYFALGLERFGEAIGLSFKVPSSMMGHRVVPLTLQFLMENAFKHNAIGGGGRSLCG